ncbi:MAG: hypothetical protein LCI03_04005, partial [Actinobacteria bacterium]|nr:hypothetical protein [Actinomycetota bacterium]
RWGHQPPIGFKVTPRPWASPPDHAGTDEPGSPEQPGRRTLRELLRLGPPSEPDPDDDIPPF